MHYHKYKPTKVPTLKELCINLLALTIGAGIALTIFFSILIYNQ